MRIYLRRIYQILKLLRLKLSFIRQIHAKWNTISNIDMAIYYRIGARSTFSPAGFTGESFRNISRMEKRFLTFDMTRQDDFAIECWRFAECCIFATTEGESERLFYAACISACFCQKFQYISFNI